MRPLKIQVRRDYQRTLISYLANEEVQAYTMAILSFFALAFFSVFAIRPTLISFFTLQKQIQDATTVEKDLDKKINDLLQAQEAYQLHQQELLFLADALPSEPKFPELVKKIETLVNENEATMTAFRTNEFSLLHEKDKNKKDSEGLTSVDFTMSLSPTYFKGESIVKRLLNLRRIILLTALTATGQADEKNKATVETNLDGSAYYVASEENN